MCGCPAFTGGRRYKICPYRPESGKRENLHCPSRRIPGRYTLTITANEKVFSPEYRRSVTDDIVETAKNIYMNIREANDTVVRMGTPFQTEDFRRRNRLQQEALQECRRLLYLMDLAHRLFHLSSKRVKYWGTLTIEVRNRIQGWMDRDAQRYLR